MKITLADIIYEIREEIGYTKFLPGDEVICHAFSGGELSTFDPFFSGKVFEYNESLGIYLISCPGVYGHKPKQLVIIPSEEVFKILNEKLTYIWVTEDTLKLITTNELSDNIHNE